MRDTNSKTQITKFNIKEESILYSLREESIDKGRRKL